MKKNRIVIREKQLAILAIFFSLFSLNAQAQKSSGGDEPFHKGSNSIGVALGLPVSYGYDYDNTSLPTLAIIYDHGIIDEVGPGNIGIGGVIAMNYASNNNWFGGYKVYTRSLIFGVRGTYHLTLLADKNNKFDPYAGIMTGIRSEEFSDSYNIKKPIPSIQ